MVSKNNSEVALNDFKSQDELISEIEKTLKSFKDGDTIEGKIVKVDRDEVLVDVQYKTEGVIPVKELSIQRNVNPNDLVKVGDTVEALVIQKEDREGRLILSKKRAIYEKAWDEVAKVKEEDGIIQGTVIEIVNGGAMVDIGLRGFLPASLVDVRRVKDLTPYLHKTLDFKVIELDKARNNVVLSHKEIILDAQKEARSEFLSQLSVGQIRKGIVSSIQPWGAFVDLGAVDGLVHVSDVSWNHISSPDEVLSLGDEVTVEVIKIEDESGRISLSIKATQEDPWQVFARNHSIGQIVPGEVVKLVTFGAFIKVTEGIEGLVYISELSSKHIAKPNQITNVGDSVFAKIVDIDLERRRISLSVKQANESIDPHSEEFDASYYTAASEFDEDGNYIFPEGYDAKTEEWLPGFEEQKIAWETNYLTAKLSWENHKKFILDLQAKEAQIVEEVEEVATKAKSRTRKKASDTESFVEADINNTLENNADLAALKEQLDK